MASTGEAAVGISASCANGSARAAPERSELAQAGSAPLAQSPLLLWSLCSLLSIAVLLFLGFSWSGYRKTYPASDSNFRVGSTQAVEITLVREDVHNLACASNLRSDSLRCGFDAARRPIEALGDRDTLRPYNTVKSELLLVAGLWSALPPAGQLPRARFTAVCDYHVTAVFKSAALRWAPKGHFEPLERSTPAGFVSSCVIPP